MKLNSLLVFSSQVYRTESRTYKAGITLLALSALALSAAAIFAAVALTNSGTLPGKLHLPKFITGLDVATASWLAGVIGAASLIMTGHGVYALSKSLRNQPVALSGLNLAELNSYSKDEGKCRTVVAFEMLWVTLTEEAKRKYLEALAECVPDTVPTHGLFDFLVNEMARLNQQFVIRTLFINNLDWLPVDKVQMVWKLLTEELKQTLLEPRWLDMQGNNSNDIWTYAERFVTNPDVIQFLETLRPQSKEGTDS